ncbi:MAG: two-component regulator propeller domain-containing protein [Ignavibacteriaceae bacterium]|jgi:signal transduction histidine kinase/ligand-binding sensor domain-containing protein|nr:two-component regulator propeller domain-containing protein [Ignavibacteriaceae bacterium]
MILLIRKIFFYVWILLLLLFGNKNFAQSISFGQISAQKELSNRFVNCLIQDRTGFIWFGTDDGLNRFDGYEIKVHRNNPEDAFSISENIIWALCEDHSGNLWIGTKSGGLNKYDYRTNKFQHWNLESVKSDKISITYIFEDSEHRIWIGTYRNGIYRFDPEQNKFEHWQNTSDNPNLISDNFITSIIEDQDLNIWIATYTGLDKFIPQETNIPFKRVMPDFKSPIWYLVKSSFVKNTIWMGTYNGLYNFDPMNEKISQINLPENYDLQFANSVSSVAEEFYLGERLLWVGTFGGLVKINLTTGYKERFIQTKEEKSELVSNQIHDLIVDKSGVLWIATENGLNYHSQKRSKFNSPGSSLQFQKFFPQLSTKNVRAITQLNDDTFWFGTDAGLIGIKNSNDNQQSIKSPELKSLNVWSLSKGSSNNIWIGTYGEGLKEYRPETNQLKSWEINNPSFNVPAYDYVKTVLEDKDKNIWIGFWGGGLARLDSKTAIVNHWRNDKDKPYSLSHNDVWSLYQDRKGRIWIGTNGGGLNLYNGDIENEFQNWKSDNGKNKSLSSNNIYAIYESAEGNNLNSQTLLWIGTANGLNKFVIENDTAGSDVSKQKVEITSFTVEDGLPDNAIESILEDENGNLWIGTSTGISFFNVREKHFTNYTSADGLSGGSFSSNAALSTSNGIILFGCTSGLNFFDPHKIKQSTYSPPVVITDFQIYNQQAKKNNQILPASGILNSKEFDLSYNQNDFSFQFASLDYNAPEENQYAYLMDGFDDDWIYSGKRRFVTYTNLDPGEYIFRVKATNSDGMWSENTAEIFIVINPPFWQTWWAYTIYALALIGGLAFIRAADLRRRKRKEEERLKREREAARLREAELKAINIEQEKELEKQKIRNRIAQDLHDEIGSNLSSISLMSELIQKDEKIDNESSEKIKRIHKVAKGSTQAIRDIVWLTNPSSDSLKDLISKMNEVADNILGKFNLKFDYPNDVVEINLLPETKRNIFFIYKEALNNIIKHAEAKSVNIKFNVENGSIFLTIKDDGKGFNNELISSGNGLKNIKSRASEINGDLKFESSPGNGTNLELVVNITQLRD